VPHAGGRPRGGEPYSAAAFHPDSRLILGTGTADSLVRIWDIKSQVSAFSALHYYTSTLLHYYTTVAAFHPDGLILGTGTADSLVRIWDIKSQVSTLLCPIVLPSTPDGLL